jgi:hypothetical protein
MVTKSEGPTTAACGEARGNFVQCNQQDDALNITPNSPEQRGALHDMWALRGTRWQLAARGERLPAERGVIIVGALP